MICSRFMGWMRNSWQGKEKGRKEERKIMIVKWAGRIIVMHSIGVRGILLIRIQTSLAGRLRIVRMMISRAICFQWDKDLGTRTPSSQKLED